MMKLFAFIILMYCLLDRCHCGSLPTRQQTEQTLVASLINSNYNKNIRPYDIVSVDITATIQQILSIDEKQQIMTSSLFISQTWYDDRLSWNASNYSDIYVLMLPVKSLWIPDTMILNSADTSGYFTISDYSLASVGDDGQVYMILPALTIKTRCNMYVQNFPFDRQMCCINLTSWAQGANRINYTEDKTLVIDTSEYTDNALWALNGTDMIVYHAGDRTPFEETYTDVISIQLYIQRKPLYFMMNGIFACLVLNCVILIAYALPFGTQTGLCMTCFMTYSVYSLAFSSIFPQQSLYIMTITLFFLLSIFWTFISMGWFVTCNYYTTKGELPKWLFDFAGRLQKIFFCCFPPAKKDDKMDKKKDGVAENGDLTKSSNQETTKATSDEPVKCAGCQRLFAPCLRRRVKVETINTIDTDAGVESVKTNPPEALPVETPASGNAAEPNEKEKPKCNFCNRCETCQVDFDKDKAKGKAKKEIEGRCNAINYLVFIIVALCIFISNMALWLMMAQ